MGKGKRSREQRAGKRVEMKIRAAKQKRRSKIKKIIGVCVAAVAALGVAAIIVYNTVAATG